MSDPEIYKDNSSLQGDNDKTIPHNKTEVYKKSTLDSSANMAQKNLHSINDSNKTPDNHPKLPGGRQLDPGMPFDALQFKPQSHSSPLDGVNSKQPVDSPRHQTPSGLPSMATLKTQYQQNVVRSKQDARTIAQSAHRVNSDKDNSLQMVLIDAVNGLQRNMGHCC